MDFFSLTGNAVSSIFSTNLLSQQSILVSISLVVIIAAILALISKFLKQEFILGYILAGIIIGPLCLGLIKDSGLINGLAEIGITFLLFVAGMEMSLKKFRGRLKTIFLTTIIQVVSVALLSFFIFLAFRFTSIESIWLGIAIALSSTVVVTKILADKNELNTVHARLILGIMLVQDIIAIIALALISKQFSFLFILTSVLRLLALCFMAFLLNKTIKPIIRKAASSSELLLII